jgi:hypothetical protein
MFYLQKTSNHAGSTPAIARFACPEGNAGVFIDRYNPAISCSNYIAF